MSVAWYDSPMTAGRPWSPRKLIARAIAFLLLGAIANVAVAWACAYWFTDSTRMEVPSSTALRVYSDGERQIAWSVDVVRDARQGVAVARSDMWDVTEWSRRLEDTEITPEELVPAWAPQIDRGMIAQRPEHPNFPGHRGAVIVGRGWPFIAGTCELADNLDGTYRAIDAIDLGWGSQNPTTFPGTWMPRLLPLDTYVRGFAANTLFYAGILGLLWLTPGVIRRRVRRARGRCPACGYVIAPGTGGLRGVCSECGTDVPREQHSRILQRLSHV